MPERSPTAAAPPLWLWAVSLAVAAAILATTAPAFLAAREAAEKTSPATRFDHAIEAFGEEPSPGPLRVIAFGDSALATATLQGKEMKEYAGERGVEVDFLRLWVPFCQLHQVLPAMDEVFEAKPDVLMIESWPLVYKLDRISAEAHRDFQAERAAGLRGGLRQVAALPSLVADHQAFVFERLTGEGVALPDERDDAIGRGRNRERMRCDPASRRRMMRRVEARARADEPLSVDPLLRQSIETLLDRARAHGVRVVFFDIPRAPQIESLPSIQAKHAVTRELLHEYVDAGRAEYLEYGGGLADDDTCDYVHFTEKGQRSYLPWFVDRLAELRREISP